MGGLEYKNVQEGLDKEREGWGGQGMRDNQS